MNKLLLAGLLSLGLIQLAQAIDADGQARLSKLKAELSSSKRQHTQLTQKITRQTKELARAEAEEHTKAFHNRAHENKGQEKSEE